MLVIASIRGWDGTRILGAFESEDKAMSLCRDAGFDVDGDEFYIDIVEINQVSDSQNLVLDPDTTSRNFKRIHVYSGVLSADHEDSKEMNI